MRLCQPRSEMYGKCGDRREGVRVTNPSMNETVRNAGTFNRGSFLLRTRFPSHIIDTFLGPATPLRILNKQGIL